MISPTLSLHNWHLTKNKIILPSTLLSRVRAPTMLQQTATTLHRNNHDSGTTWTTVTLPNGKLSYGDISYFIQQSLETKRHSKPGIKVKILPSFFRVLILLETNYQEDLQTGNFADLLGFYEDIVTATSCGTKLPGITTSVDNIFIHTNIIVIVLLLVLVPIFCIVNLLIIYLRVFHCILSLRASYDKINSNIIKEMHIHLTDALYRHLYFNNILISKEEWNM